MGSPMWSDWVVPDQGDDWTSAAVASKTAQRRRRRKHVGQRSGDMVPAECDANPRSAAFTGYDATIERVSPNLCHRSVVTVCDLGLGVITQSPTPSLPQRRSPAHTCNDVASLQAQ